MQFKGPVFRAIGDGKMSDLKVSGYTGDIVSELVTISKLNEYGVNYCDLIWLDIEDEENPGTKLYYGWYYYTGEDDPVDHNGNPLVAGEGLYVYPQEEAVGWDLVNSGEVAQDGVAYKTVSGMQFVANAAPMDELTFGDIEVSGYTGDIVSELVTISKLNEYGVNYCDLIWLDIEDEENPGTKLYYGWYYYTGEDDPVDHNADPVASGEGLYLYPQDEAVGWTITFPGIN